MDEKLKNGNVETGADDKKEINPEDLEQVTGGGNPFAQYARVPNQEYDSKIRDKA